MIDIRLFTGSDQLLADFIQATWLHDYRGKMIFPLWTADYFSWQLKAENSSSKRLIVAAYDDQKLVAVLAGNTYDFYSVLGPVTGSQWSWLSIHPDYRGLQLAKKLNQFRIELLRELKQELIISYRYVGSKVSQAERPKKQLTQHKFHSKIGFWSRVLHPQNFSRWHVNSLERNLVWMTSPFIPQPKISVPDADIKRYDTAYLSEALSLIQEAKSQLSLSIAWNENTLQNQLAGSPLAQSWVALKQNKLAALINFHILEFQGLTTEKVAVIDLLVCLPEHKSALNLLMKQAMASMYEQGAILALKLRCGDTLSSLMLQQHFLPLPADSYLVLDWLNQHVSIPKNSRLQILWR